MSYKETIRLLTNDGQEVLTFNVDRPHPVVMYKGQTYFRNATFSPGKSGWPYYPCEVTKLEDPKVARVAPADIPRQTLKAMSDEARQYGFVVTYRNRDGKVYARVVWTANTTAGKPIMKTPRPDRFIVQKYFPDAVHTSGGYGTDSGDHTYRLNP